MENRTIADSLLWPLWRGLPDAYKMKYARTIWNQFEDNLRSAAYTSSLSKFLSSVCIRLGIDVAAKELTGVQAVIGSGEDRDVLGKLRNETTYLVLLVRLRNEERKETLATEKAAREDEGKRAELNL